MRSTLCRLALTAALGAATLAGCGDDADTSDGQAPAADPDAATSTGGSDGAEEATWPPVDGLGSGAAGEVTVDGVTYAIDATRLCDMTDFFAGEGRTRDLHVEGIGLVDPDDEYSETVEVTVFTGTTDNPERQLQGLGWDGPEGLFEGEATGGDGAWMVVSDSIDGPPLEIGDRITGELRLRSTMGREPVSASIDVEHPTGDPVPCD